MEGLPTGTVTVLFTDLEGSTRLWRQEPEPMRSALARHDEIVRDAVVASNGFVVKTTGDGCFAVFEEPAPAIAAAVAGQLALGAEAWPVSEPLRVRMGIHTGPAELRDGDYHGTTLNRAARLMGAAHGGQIVLSHATAQLVAEADVELLDLGEHVLRDLGRPERIFQVLGDGIGVEFPQLASLGAFEGNLPAQLTSFVGRTADVAQVATMLEEARLVTLAGTGGVGKTRLAVQVAAEVLPRFSSGAWLCELAAADDEETLVQVVSAALGCRQHPGRSLSASIVEYLKVRELLLVLDNCEHLLDEAGDLTEAVLRNCPDVTVLATSREALAVAGEHVMRVRSLATPDAAGAQPVLQEAAAVRLFRDRAFDAGVDVTWDDQQWDAVGEICRRVDGIPLAIELAAARSVAMSPSDVAGHLDERFRLLTGKRRGRVERHRTLRATVEWSYHLLEADEQALFDRLGTFAGSFDTAAAVAVGGDGIDEWSMTDVLASLVAKSMLVAEPGPGGTTRFTMLETLRQYARERLDATGEVEACRRALAHHLAAFATEAAHGVLGSDDAAWLGRIRADIDNLRAILGWAFDSRTPEALELGLAIVAPLAWIGQNCSDLGLDLYAMRAVPLLDAASAELRIPILTLAAHHWWRQGDNERARRLVETALDHGVITALPNALEPYNLLVAIEMGEGHHERAFELIEQARTRSVLSTNEIDVARLLAGFGCFEAMAGRIEIALADSERALRIARRAGNENLLANALNGRAWALQRDHPQAALALAEEFLVLYRRDHIARSVAPGLGGLAAGLSARLGDDERALHLLRDSLVISRDDGTLPQAAGSLGFGLRSLRQTGRPHVAVVFIGALEEGALAEVAQYPGAADGRARALAALRRDLDDHDDVDRLLAQGAAMSYDELMRYAIDQLSAPGALHPRRLNRIDEGPSARTGPVGHSSQKGTLERHHRPKPQ